MMMRFLVLQDIRVHILTALREQPATLREQLAAGMEQQPERQAGIHLEVQREVERQPEQPAAAMERQAATMERQQVEQQVEQQPEQHQGRRPKRRMVRNK